MCLTTNDPAIKVATEDIVVYKLLQYPTKVGFFKRLFKSSLTWPFSTVWGYHLYQPKIKQPIVKMGIEEGSDDEWTVHEGYHSYVSPRNCNAKCIIPKGAQYIEGWNNDNKLLKNYVSETIVYVGKL